MKLRRKQDKEERKILQYQQQLENEWNDKQTQQQKKEDITKKKH